MPFMHMLNLLLFRPDVRFTLITPFSPHAQVFVQVKKNGWSFLWLSSGLSLTHESTAKILSCMTFPPFARFKNTRAIA